jgi:hypothetical protein
LTGDQFIAMFKFILLFFLAIIHPFIIPSNRRHFYEDEDEEDYGIINFFKSLTIFKWFNPKESSTSMEMVSLDLQDHLRRVIVKLNGIKGKNIPNPNQSTFTREIYQMIQSSKNESILKSKSFWLDLSLLFHEWIKHSKERNRDPKDINKFEIILKNTKSLIDNINKRYPSSQFVLDHFSINIFISSTMRDKIRINPQLRRIFNYFDGKIPISLIEIIGDYSQYYDDTIYEFLDQIMNDLKVSSIERNSLNLYSSFFSSWLLKMVKEKKAEFPHYHLFWYDLDRFMFKWILAMRRILSDNDQAFEALATNIDPIIAIIHKDGFDYSDEMISILTSIKSNFSIFERFIRHEFIDNPEILRYFIDHVIKDLYDDHDHSILKIDCQQLLNRHFDGQSFNSNPLLKLMLISLTPEEIAEKIRKKCFPEENSCILNYHGFTILISKTYTQQGYSSEDIRWIESINGSYSSSKMIKFFLDNKLGFRIYSSFGLIKFLRRLVRLTLLQEIPLDRIIKFLIKSENTWRWDINIFKEYLEERGEYNDLIKKYEII